MKTNLKLPEITYIALLRAADQDAARRYANRSRSDSTWRTYVSAWQRFEAYCHSVGLLSLPAEPGTVAMFVAAEADAGRSVSTLSHRLSAIRLMHLSSGTAPRTTHNQ